MCTCAAAMTSTTLVHFASPALDEGLLLSPQSADELGLPLSLAADEDHLLASLSENEGHLLVSPSVDENHLLSSRDVDATLPPVFLSADTKSLPTWAI